MKCVYLFNKQIRLFLRTITNIIIISLKSNLSCFVLMIPIHINVLKENEERNLTLLLRKYYETFLFFIFNNFFIAIKFDSSLYKAHP